MKIKFFLQLFLLFGILSIQCSLNPKPVYTSDGVKPPDKSSEVEGSKEASNPGETSRLTSTSSLESSQRENFMREIEDLLGVPYKAGGATPAGMDCSGFVHYVFQRAIGMELPRNSQNLYEIGHTVAETNLQFADMVFFTEGGYGSVSHVGIYLEGGYFAHASTSKGVTISRLDESYYKERYLGARRVIHY